jgi:hypothetical protein
MVIIKKVFDTSFALVGGYIKQYKEGTGNAKGKVINITLDDGMEIAFWDSQFNKTAKLATRLKMANAKVNSFITVLVHIKDETNKKAQAINFKYGGVWSFKEKTPVSTDSGFVMDITDDGETIAVMLDTGNQYIFENHSQGYKMADRARKKVTVGDEIEVVADENNSVSNFKSGGEDWEILKNINAIVGKVSFVDEGFNGKAQKPYIEVKTGYCTGKDASGNYLFESKSAYFNNDHNEDMIGAVKEKLLPKTQAAIVCAETSKDNFDGYYFVTFNS